jgi:hypothetical protein
MAGRPGGIRLRVARHLLMSSPMVQTQGCTGSCCLRIHRAPEWTTTHSHKCMRSIAHFRESMVAFHVTAGKVK